MKRKRETGTDHSKNRNSDRKHQHLYVQDSHFLHLYPETRRLHTVYSTVNRDTTMTQPLRRSNITVGPRFFLHHFRQRWRAWRQRVQARKALRRLDNDRLEDIGLTRRDVDNLW
ncbi:DUF1127 domain-containing protein [Dickeya dadantii]|uniref:DUF1127 domain-containing protein n=1 Tax=Dickeya dadantii TaxID=204038 RepID=UPI0031345913